MGLVVHGCRVIVRPTLAEMRESVSKLILEKLFAFSGPIGWKNPIQPGCLMNLLLSIISSPICSTIPLHSNLCLMLWFIFSLYSGLLEFCNQFLSCLFLDLYIQISLFKSLFQFKSLYSNLPALIHSVLQLFYFIALPIFTSALVTSSSDSNSKLSLFFCIVAVCAPFWCQ